MLEALGIAPLSEPKPRTPPHIPKSTSGPNRPRKSNNFQKEKTLQAITNLLCISQKLKITLGLILLCCTQRDLRDRSHFTMPRPSFSQLPLSPSDPPHSAWGLYGPNGQLGTLNLLTPEVIKEASKEIQTGVRIGLTLPMNFLLRPSHNRLGIRHEIIHKSPRAVYDDVIEMNTQVRFSGLNLDGC